MNNAQRFCLELELHTVRGETTSGFTESFSDTSSVRVGLFLANLDGEERPSHFYSISPGLNLHPTGYSMFCVHSFKYVIQLTCVISVI